MMVRTSTGHMCSCDVSGETDTRGGVTMTWRRRLLVAASAAVVLVLAACGGDDADADTDDGGPSDGPAAIALEKQGFPDNCPAPSESFDRMNAATYQVFGEAVFPGPDGQLQQFHMFIGTAWAVRDRLLVTNAHVTEAFTDSAAQGIQFSRAIAVQSGTGTVIRLLRALTHPNYDGNPIGSADVGLFTSEQALPVLLELADADSVLSLGDDIQIVGFPGDVENFITVIPGETVPQVTSLTGNISARRSHDDTEAVTPETLNLYQHQAPTSPGTSGGHSPTAGSWRP